MTAVDQDRFLHLVDRCADLARIGEFRSWLRSETGSPPPAWLKQWITEERARAKVELEAVQKLVVDAIMARVQAHPDPDKTLER